MKTFGYKRKMYLIIFSGLIYNLYLYQQEDITDHEPIKSPAMTISITERLNLKDSFCFEIIKSVKQNQLMH